MVIFGIVLIAFGVIALIASSRAFYFYLGDIEDQPPDRGRQIALVALCGLALAVFGLLFVFVIPHLRWI